MFISLKRKTFINEKIGLRVHVVFLSILTQERKTNCFCFKINHFLQVLIWPFRSIQIQILDTQNPKAFKI